MVNCFKVTDNCPTVLQYHLTLPFDTKIDGIFDSNQCHIYIVPFSRRVPAGSRVPPGAGTPRRLAGWDAGVGW